MARLVTSGGEIQEHPTTDIGSPDGWSAGATTTTSNTSLQRGGLACFACAGTTTNTSFRAFSFTTPASGATLYGRGQIMVDALPASGAKKVLAFVTSADGALVSVRLTSGGKFQLFNDVAGTQIGSDSTLTAAVSTYYRVQLRLKIGSGSVDEAEMRVYLNGSETPEEAVSATGLGISDTHASRLRAGWIDAPGATANLYLDAVGVNNDTGTNENSWPGQGIVVLSQPVWAAGSGGTNTDCSGASASAPGANFANAVNNTPPRGQADHTTAGHASDPDQLRSSGTAGFKFRCQTFQSLGAIGDMYQGYGLLATSVQIGSGSTTTNNGEQYAQPFFMNGTLESFSFQVNWRRVDTTNTPPPDRLIVSLVEDNAGQPTGAVIQQWAVSGSDSAFTGSAGDFRSIYLFTLTTPQPTGRLLWVRFEREGGVVDSTVYWTVNAVSSEYFLPGYEIWTLRSGTWISSITNAAAMNSVALFYTSQGVRTPKVLTGWLCTGEAIATGTKTITNFSVTTTSATPSGSSGDVGNDVGAAATYPSNWAWLATPTYYRPAVNNSTDKLFAAPLIQATFTSSTRVSLICFAGVYAELDEAYATGWQRKQKSADSSIWWAKQATATTTYECGSDGQTVVTVNPGDWLAYPDPQVTAGGNIPSTAVVIASDTMLTSYTDA